MKGIDISSWQSSLSNVQTLKNNGVSFVILKITEGRGLADSSFSSHYQKFSAINIPIGAYVYAHATTEDEAIAEAKFALSTLANRALQLPIYYDVEANNCFLYGREATTNCIRAFIKEIENAGYKGGIYSNKYHFEAHINLPALQSEGVSVWAAQYNGSEDRILNCDIRQYSDREYVEGFSGPLDANILFNQSIIKNYPTKQEKIETPKIEQKTPAYEKLLNEARKWIGYHEVGENNTPFTNELWDNKLYGWDLTGQPWCDIFVDYCFVEAYGYQKAKELTYQYDGCSGAACAYSAQHYKNNGAFYNYPEIGDQIFFYVNGGINHTGIVERIEGSTVITIEGNTSDQVARRTYIIDSSNIAGYGRPKWNILGDINETNPIVENIEKPQTTSAFKAGDVVRIIKGATYYTGISIPDFVMNDTWIILQVYGDRAVLNKNLSGTRSIMSPINTKYLELANTSTPKEEKPVETKKTYVVKSGDTLWGIAKTYLGSGLKYPQIKKANNLTSDTIYVGQELIIP